MHKHGIACSLLTSISWFVGLCAKEKKICLAPCCNENFVWLPEESASIQLELITEYLNTAPTISCECMRTLHSWGKRHGLIIVLRDMLNIYIKSINLSSLSCYILLFYKMCINMYKIVLTWVFNRPPTIKPLCKENGGEHLVLLEKIQSSFNHDDCHCSLTSN